MAELKSTSLYSDANLKAYWQMEGNSNTTVGSFNGTDSNMSYGTGKYGQGAIFNGTSSKITLSSVTFTSAGSVCFWMQTNFNNTSDGSQRVMIDTTTPRQFLFFYEPAYSPKQFGWDSGGANVIDPFTYSFGNISGQWHHWAFVWTTTTSWNVYYDGVVIQSGTSTITTGTPTTMTFGVRFSGASSFFPGTLDDIAYFDRALTANEVNLLSGNPSNMLMMFR